MEQNSRSFRLHALDGIRGFAIILVVLNHINTLFINPLIGSFLSQILFTSGVTGVTLLFILSGFFMASIYPNPANSLHFLQKRYTRIFPLFLTLVAVRFNLWLMPHLNALIQIGIILLYSLFTYVIWVYLVKKFASTSVRKLMFFSFLILQIFMGLFYAFYIMRQPPIFFFYNFPYIFRETTIALVNATLTLPLGNYVPMLDGVYWSLVAEVLFYVLYPIICVPLINFLKLRKRWEKITFLILLIPLFCSLTLLTSKLFVLSMIQVYICFYFIAGIILGYIYKNKSYLIEKLDKLLPNKLSILTLFIFLFLIFYKTIFLGVFPQSFSPLIHILWAFPLTFVMAFALNHKTFLSKFLSSNFLVFLGTISYSIYLTHTTILHMVIDHNLPTNLFINIIQIIIIFILVIIISSITYYFLERPYFKRDKNENKNVDDYKESKIGKIIRTPQFIFSFFIGFYILSIFLAYQSNFNLFSLQNEFKNLTFLNPKMQNSSGYISMKKHNTIKFEITSTENNFAILILHIIHKSTGQINIHTNQKLIFKIKQLNDKNWYAINSYAVGEIKDSKNHLLAFPPIVNSKDKMYLVDLTLSNPSDADYILMDTNPYYIKGDYIVNKSELIHQPKAFINFIFYKIEDAFSNPEAQLVTVLFIPFGVFSIYLLMRKRKYISF